MVSTSNNVDLVVIGGGPAGLAAAYKAKEVGLDKVVIVERGEELGGLLPQCIHNGFGLTYFNKDMTGPEYAQRFIEKVSKLKVDVFLETMVLRLTPDRKVTICNRNGIRTLVAKAVILTMGCRERTRESLMIPGARPAGIFTSGTAQRIINIEGYLPGNEIVILGSGDIGMIVARRLVLEKVNVKAMVEILPYVGGLIRNQAQCINDFEIPVLLRHTITNIYGMPRIEGVTVARVNNKRQPISGTEKDIRCDALLLSVGLIPENELSREAGIELDPITGGPVVNERMGTNIPGIFSAGNVVHINDLVDNVTIEGEIAGWNAAEYTMKKRGFTEHRIKLRNGENIKYVTPQYILADTKEVFLSMRVKKPEENVIVQVGDILTKSLHAVRPSELLRVKLSKKELRRIKEETSELIVTCKKKK